jgi:hypothetical protein
MSDDADKTPAQIEAIEKETRSFVCPTCGDHLQFLVSVLVKGVHSTPTADEIATRDGQPLPAKKITKVVMTKAVRDDSAAVQQAKADGTWDAYVTAIKAAYPQQQPKDLSDYFDQWLKAATRLRTPQFAIRSCLPVEDREGNLELWVFSSLAAVVVDGRLKTFIPYQLVKGEPLPDSLALGGNGIERRKASSADLAIWVKTRNGYVAGKGLLFNELKGKRAGQFETTVR